MSKISTETVVRVDNVNWEDWKIAKELLEEDGIWFTESTNEDGYNLVECNEENVYTILVKTGILSISDAGICEHVIKPEELLIVF